MDWRVLMSQQCILLVFITFQDTQAIQDVKEKMKRRRQHARQGEAISFKPPPEDWPEPDMGVADYYDNDKPSIAPMSPLQAYQKKLQQDMIKQQQQEAQEKLRANTMKDEPHSLTSSEEDFQKLLDPNELLKHNKQLKPFVRQDSRRKLGIAGGKSPYKQGKLQGKPSQAQTRIAETSKSKTTRKRTRQVAPKLTVKPSKARKRKQKTVQDTLLEHNTPLIDIRGRESEAVDITTTGPKRKRRRKKIRKFSFAGGHSKEAEESNRREKRRTTTTKPGEELSTTSTTKEKEARQKRKQIRQQMKSVIKTEHLEGSLDDKDSDWQTSEEEFYVEYFEMEKAFKEKIAALEKLRMTKPPNNVTTVENMYKNKTQFSYEL